VRNFVPQLDVLDRVDAFITHGGMNSAHEGLLAGVPLIAVPQQPEQAMVAMQVNATRVGLGLQLHPPYGDVSADDLRQALDSVLADASYAERAAALGAQMRAAGGAPRVVELLHEFAAQHKVL
jgi:MGT family glycosyltransferase